jgi:hypothetical protein
MSGEAFWPWLKEQVIAGQQEKAAGEAQDAQAKNVPGRTRKRTPQRLLRATHRPLGYEPNRRGKPARSECPEKQRVAQLSNLLSRNLVIGSKYAEGSRGMPRGAEEHGKKAVNDVKNFSRDTAYF